MLKRTLIFALLLLLLAIANGIASMPPFRFIRPVMPLLTILWIGAALVSSYGWNGITRIISAALVILGAVASRILAIQSFGLGFLEPFLTLTIFLAAVIATINILRLR